MRFEGVTAVAAQLAEREGAEELARRFSVTPKAPSAKTLHDVIVAYRSAPEGLNRLADSTRRNWAPWLDEIEEVFGTLPLNALRAKSIVGDFIAWRDTRAGQPRSADYGMQVLRRVLSFGIKRGLIDTNPAIGVETLYRASRADKIVTDVELEGILGLVTREAAWAIRLAAATGIRRGDLIALRWADVDGASLEFATSKSGGSQRALVPLIGDGQAVIGEIADARARLIEADNIPSSFLLTTKHGGPWSRDSLTQAFGRAAAELGIDRNFHDLRGTAITRFINQGWTDEQVAEVVGWMPLNVRQIRRRYVDRNQIAEALIRQVERATNSG
jgi:integrase